MSSSQLTEPIVARSGSSIHSREEDEYTEQHEDNPLEMRSNSSVQPTPSHMVARNPLDDIQIRDSVAMDEPPPPYEEPTVPIVDAPQIAPIEYSVDNSPQLLNAPQSEWSLPIEPPPRNPARLSASTLPEVSPIQSPGSPAASQDPSLMPAPLQIRPAPSNESIPRRPLASQTFSSAKAREAGFEIQPPTPSRTDSMSSHPSITFLSSTETLQHTRQPGKLTAYLIPFPKPRLKGVKAEDIPDRFLVYTPPLPPLSKPAPGEKESQWHKTRRLWQEDVRKAMVTNASKATWKGLKARSTTLIAKGVNLTRSSNVEFLDRAAEGAITSTADEVETQVLDEQPLTASPEHSPATTPIEETPRCGKRKFSSKSIEKDAAPKNLEELTLVYPPTLDLAPEKIRTEFVESLLRTRDKSRKEAVVASSLFPVAAAIDASLLITFGGLMEVSGVWAYTSIRGAMTSKKMTQGLALAEEQAAQKHEEETEVRGCTCGHHEDDFGTAEAIPKTKDKGKKKKTGINLRMQKSSHLEILRRYLELTCLKKEFNMFPQIEEAAGDVNEAAVLEAIGWKPTRRQGRDLELEFKDKIEKLTPEQDELWQLKDAKDDVRRIMKKGASEWVIWCKSFQKDPEAAMKR